MVRTRGGALDVEDARQDLHFLGLRHPQEVLEVPLAPTEVLRRAEQLPPTVRGAATFSPEATVAASAFPQDGRVTEQRGTPQSNAAQPSRVELESRLPTRSSAFTSRASTRAPQNAPSTTITAASQQPNSGTRSARRRPNQRQRLLARVEELEQQLRQAQNSRREPDPSVTGLPPSYESSCLGAAILPERTT